MKIKITSDSTCDLSPELLRENDIELFPLFINKGDESFRDGVDIQPADIFAHVAAGGALCSTAAVPVGVFHDRFAELAKEYDAVFHVNIGSRLLRIASERCSRCRGPAECLRYRFPQPLHRSGPCCARGLPPCKDRHGP